STAESYLNQATAILDEDEGVDRLFVHKWRSILLAFKSGDPSPIEEFRVQAQKVGHWESVRDADFHLLKMTKDERLFKKLYFGITESGGAYHFVMQPGFVVRFRNDAPEANTVDIQIQRLREHFANHKFSARQASDRLRLPSRTMLRILKNGIESGELFQDSAGP